MGITGIAVEAIESYLRCWLPYYDLEDREEFLAYIGAMDDALLKHYHEKHESEHPKKKTKSN